MSKPYPTIVCNLGLGDLIVLSGGIVHLASMCGGARVPALDYNLVSARAIFIDYPEIEIFQVNSDQHVREVYRDDPNAIPCYWVRVEGVIINPAVSWDVWMYEKLGVDFRHRWDSCPIEKAALHFSQVEFKEPYYLVHDDTSRGFDIRYAPWHPVIPTHRIYKSFKLPFLCWVEPIRRAKELHFMDSCGIHLAECMYIEDVRQDKFYWHRYPRFRKPVWHDVQKRHHWHNVDLVAGKEI